MAIKKLARGLVKKGRKYAKKRYQKRTTGAVRTGRIARDVMMLKRLVNTEKKSSTVNSGLVTTGQVNGNSSGAYCLYIQPSLTRGTGAGNYTGNSVKLVSGYLQFQIQQQSGQQTDTEYIFEMWNILGQPDTSGVTTLENIFDASVFSTVIDSYSSRNQNEFADYKLIRSFKVRFPMDQYASTNAQLKTIQIPMKLNHHLRFNSDNTIANGQLALTIRSNSGNMNATVPSTLAGIPVSTVNTGAEVRYALKWYYVDN